MAHQLDWTANELEIIAHDKVVDPVKVNLYLHQINDRQSAPAIEKTKQNANFE